MSRMSSRFMAMSSATRIFLAGTEGEVGWLKFCLGRLFGVWDDFMGNRCSSPSFCYWQNARSSGKAESPVSGSRIPRR